MKHLREPLFSLSTGRTANMTRTFPYRLKVIAPLVLLLVVWCISSPMAFADSINPGVLGIGATLGGQTYGQWSENWWQWAFKVTSTTLGNCPQESGQMWFLAGAPKLTTGAQTLKGSQPTETTEFNCLVPAGKNIMFPLFNAEQSVAEAQSNKTGNLPGSICALRDVNGKLIKGKGTDIDYAALLACAQAFTQHVLSQPGASLGAEVDGKELRGLTNYRASSPPPPFTFTAEPGNPFGLCELLQQCPLTTTAAADGFWIILDPPLKPGKHTIHFTAVVPFPERNLNFTYTNDVTYTLIVQ